MFTLLLRLLLNTDVNMPIMCCCYACMLELFYSWCVFAVLIIANLK